MDLSAAADAAGLGVIEVDVADSVVGFIDALTGAGAAAGTGPMDPPLTLPPRDEGMGRASADGASSLVTCCLYVDVTECISLIGGG